MNWTSVLKIKTPNGAHLVVKDVEAFKRRMRSELQAVGLDKFGKEGYVSGIQQKSKVVFKEKWIESDYGDRLEITASVRNPKITTREYFVITLLEDESGDFVFLTAIGPNMNFGADKVMNNESDLIAAIGEAVERIVLEKIEEEGVPASRDISDEERETTEQTAEQLAVANPGYESHEGKMRKIPEEKPSEMSMEEWAELSQPPKIEERGRKKRGKQKRTLPIAPKKEEPIREDKHSYPIPSRGPLGRDAWKLKKGWKTLLKKLKLNNKTNLSTNIKDVPKSNCNDELSNYANKLRTHKGILFSLSPPDEKDTREDGKPGKYFETIICRYSPIPEEVACKALEMLSNVKYENVGPIDESIKVDGKTWTIFAVIDVTLSEIDLSPPDAEYTEITADAGIMLTISKEEHKTLDEHPVLLWHAIWLEKDFAAKLENEWMREIDWR